MRTASKTSAARRSKKKKTKKTQQKKIEASDRRQSTRAATFATAAAFGRWLEQHHATADELVVVYAKRATGVPSMTWPESVREALRFGWIDSVRHRLDDARYSIRFTPRRPGSTWSRINIAVAEQLIASGEMTPAGRAAFDARLDVAGGGYSYEHRPEELPEPWAARLRAHGPAHAFFSAQPASYRRAATWWVVSAAKEATRAKRLDTLIADSAAGQRIAPLRRAVRT